MPEANQRRPQSMVRRFRRCLIFVSLFCVVCAALGAAVLLQNKFTDAMLAQSCRTVARALEAGTDMTRLAGDSEVRYTLIDHNGAVLFDSEVPDTAALENHAGRPEVKAAFAAGQGVSTRQSETLDRQTRYFALRLDDDRVLRAAVDVPNLLGLLLLIFPTLAAVCLPVLGMAAVLSFWLTRRMVQPITHMAQHLDTIEADVPYEELIPLAHTVQADRQLQADNEAMRREFTANVSHELKTPLTSISGYAELLETRMARPEDVPEFGRRIHKEAGRMITLVSDILQLSELDGQQRQNFEPVPVDLAALVRDTAANMTMNARKAYVTLQYTAPDTPLMVQGGRDLLAELAMNLTDNAIRYNRPGGHVQISCGTADGCPYLQVEDNGIGIPQDAQSRVFERFYRVDKSRSKATGGTGLGLAIVKHIAMLHGAKIDLRSTVGTGTTVRVEFPAGK